MGNNLPVYRSEGVDNQKVADYIDENLWFMIKISGNASCDRNDPFSGFLRFPFDAESSTVNSGVAFYDPNTIPVIKQYKYDTGGNRAGLAGYLWRVRKINDKYFLVGKNPSGKELPLRAIMWSYSIFVSGEGDASVYAALHAGFPSGGTIEDPWLDVEKSVSTGQLWFSFQYNETKSQLLDGHLRTRSDWGELGKDKAYGRARFCDNSLTNRVEIYPVDLSVGEFSTTPMKDLSIFARPESYREWYFNKLVTRYWTQATIRAPGEIENIIQSWIKTLSPKDRSEILYQKTKRCDYPDGDTLWRDEMCRYGCNGDGTPNNITLSGCPEIGQKIVNKGVPNNWLRSELGRAYCKQNPGFCEQILNSWCQSEDPDPDSKFADSPFGKKSMCACSWPAAIQKQKILRQMPSVQVMLQSDNIFTRQVAERILQSQTAYFVCKDPECIQSAVYKNKEDRDRKCPPEQIQNCITEIKVEAGGSITIGKDIASNQACQQFYGEVFGEKELKCLREGGKLYTDQQGKNLCCPPDQTFDGKGCIGPKPCPEGTVLKDGKCVSPDPVICPQGMVLRDGKCVPEPKPDPQPNTCPLGKVLRDGKCVCPFGEDSSGNCLAKCETQRTSKGECCKPGQEISMDQCVEPCPSPLVRDQTGKCIVIEPSPDPKPNPNTDPIEFLRQHIYLVIAIVAVVIVGILIA